MNLNPVDERVEAIRLRAKSDPEGARDELWSWLNEVLALPPQQRHTALAVLDRLFKAGEPHEEYADGHNIIGVPRATVHPVLDRLIHAIFSVWQPWHGKQWSRERREGATTFTRGYMLLSLLVTPRHRFRKVGEHHWNAYTQPMLLRPSVETPHHEVLVLDYPAGERQAWMMSIVHDELTAVVPGAWLAKVYLHTRFGRRTRNVPIAYFPIRTALPGEEPIVLPGERTHHLMPCP